MVSRIRESRHWATAASQPTRLKMNTIAGSSPSRSSRSMTSTRDGIQTRRPFPTARGFFDEPGLPLRGDRRSRIRRLLAQSSRAMRSSSWLTGAPSRTKPADASTSDDANRSISWRPTITCWNSGTGRRSSTMVVVSPRTVASQAPNSSALDTVADSEITATDSGRWMITSSHTAPRIRSAR